MRNSVEQGIDGCEEPVSWQDHQLLKYQRKKEQVKYPVSLSLDQALAFVPLWGTPTRSQRQVPMIVDHLPCREERGVWSERQPGVTAYPVGKKYPAQCSEADFTHKLPLIAHIWVRDRLTQDLPMDLVRQGLHRF